jgi:ribosomal protein S18 acetylase RimI-like enzyme
MMGFWEKEMQQRGHKMLLTSTQVDEEAQHFYRKLGYQDAGSLLITIPEYQQPMELFLVKRIAVK